MKAAPQTRDYGRNFRPMPDLIPDMAVDLAELNGWKVGRNFFPAKADNTSDAGDRAYRERCDEIRTRQWRELDASTVGDVAHDERLAKCLRDGRAPAEVGKLLMDLVHERIEGIVRRNAS
ncbi:hypothetical protein [Variovorax atrisoli]|uniref:hypothetical protein n=1 Tax=Variovorax atrisoli TaxID=3394203 RepID=UPI0012FE7038|nr:hypothetical protein [Variovorax paradoxus]